MSSTQEREKSQQQKKGYHISFYFDKFLGNNTFDIKVHIFTNEYDLKKKNPTEPCVMKVRVYQCREENLARLFSGSLSYLSVR